jgi:hypothetical protein
VPAQDGGDVVGVDVEVGAGAVVDGCVGHLIVSFN